MRPRDVSIWARVTSRRPRDVSIWPRVTSRCPRDVFIWARVTSRCPRDVSIWARVTSRCPRDVFIWARVTSRCPRDVFIWARVTSRCPRDVSIWRRVTTACPSIVSFGSSASTPKASVPSSGASVGPRSSKNARGRRSPTVALYLIAKGILWFRAQTSVGGHVSHRSRAVGFSRRATVRERPGRLPEAASASKRGTGEPSRSRRTLASPPREAGVRVRRPRDARGTIGARSGHGLRAARARRAGSAPVQVRDDRWKMRLPRVRAPRARAGARAHARRGARPAQPLRRRRSHPSSGSPARRWAGVRDGDPLGPARRAPLRSCQRAPPAAPRTRSSHASSSKRRGLTQSVCSGGCLRTARAQSVRLRAGRAPRFEGYLRGGCS